MAIVTNLVRPLAGGRLRVLPRRPRPPVAWALPGGVAQAFGAVFSSLGRQLAVCPGRTAQLTMAAFVLSVVAIGPSLVGAEPGSRLQRRLPERRLRKLLFVGLSAPGTRLALGTGG